MAVRTGPLAEEHLELALPLTAGYQRFYETQPDEARGTGAGRALIAACADAARARGAEALEWYTATDNERAQRLYDRFPGAEQSAWYAYEVDLRQQLAFGPRTGSRSWRTPHHRERPSVTMHGAESGGRHAQRGREGPRYSEGPAHPRPDILRGGAP